VAVAFAKNLGVKCQNTETQRACKGDRTPMECMHVPFQPQPLLHAIGTSMHHMSCTFHSSRVCSVPWCVSQCRTSCKEHPQLYCARTRRSSESDHFETCVHSYTLQRRPAALKWPHTTRKGSACNWHQPLRHTEPACFIGHNHNPLLSSWVMGTMHPTPYANPTKSHGQLHGTAAEHTDQPSTLFPSFRPHCSFLQHLRSHCSLQHLRSHC